MRRLITFGYDRAGWVLGGAVLATLAAIFFLRSLEIDVGSESLTASHSAIRQTHEAVRGEFGSDLAAVIYAGDPGLFEAERLERLRRINDAADALPVVERVESLFTLPDIRDVGGMLETAPLLRHIPTDAEGLAAKRAQGLANPLLRRNVLAENGEAMLLTLYLDPEALENRSIRSIEAEIEGILAPHREAFAELFQLGKPALQTWLLDALRRDQSRILPAAALLLFLLLVVNQRSFVAGLLPIANGLIATAWTLGLMSVLGIPVTLLNYILPALIIVVGATEDMHILHEFRSQLARGESGAAAMRKAAEGIGLALILTALTTVLGFAATAASTLPILQSFGLAAMLGMSGRFLVSLLVLPASLRVLEKWIRRSHNRALISPLLAERASGFLVDRIVPHLRPILVIVAVLSLAAAFFTREIRLNNDLISFLDEDSEVYQQLELSATQLAGSKILFLTLYDQPGAFHQPANLKRLEDITAYLRGIEDFDTVTSFADLIKRINGQLHGGEAARETIPASVAAVQQMLLFTQADDFAAYVSADFARANIVIRCNLNDSTALNERAEVIRAELAGGRFGPQTFTLTGESLVVAAAVDSIVTAQVLSLGGMTLVLFLIVSGLFLSLRCGLLTVLGNLFPILLVFGVMGLTGISLNVGTCMVAAITLGIAIDDTLHILVRFNRELKSTMSERAGIRNAIGHELNPIVSTSLALAGGFLIMGFSSFAPVREFGFLSAGVLLLALGSDLILTPVLFANTRLVTLWDVVGLSLRKQLLRESPLFRGFSAWQAKKIILATQIEEYPAHTLVIRNGDLGKHMYVVLSGELEASLGEGANRRVLTQIKLGDVFGEVAVIAQTRRSADVTARAETRLLALDADALERLQRFSPFLSSRLFLNLSSIIGQRLLERTREIAERNREQRED